MSDREKIAELIGECEWWCTSEDIADHLLASGVTVQRWIPVAERLPEVGRRVLVTDGEHVSFGYTLITEYKGCNPWCVQFPCIYDEVTHWMPLPEPPKEGE